MSARDFLMTFSNEAAAKADAAVGTFYLASDDDGPGNWRGDCVVAPVQAITGYTAGTDGNGNPIQTPNFATGFFLMIAQPGENAALAGSAGFQVELDADPAAENSVVSGSLGSILALTPILAGRSYSFMR